MNRNTSSITRPMTTVLREMFRVILVERNTLLLLFSLFVIFLGLGLYLDRVELIPNAISTLVPNFSIDILGGIIIFVVLDRSIKYLSPIGERQRLPTNDFIYDIEHNTHSEVKILDTWIYFLNEKIYREAFIHSLREALKKGVQFQVLIIDPKSDAAKQRAEELRGSSENIDVIDQVKRCIAYWQLARNLIKLEIDDLSRLEVKVYDANPGITYYSHDKSSYIGFFPVKLRADLSVQLEVPLTTSLGLLASERFAQLWDHAQAVNSYLDDPRNLDVAQYVENFMRTPPD